ncbi:MAG: hypothetical protein ACXWBN_21035, partial [Acidimicrobiales bacterium]
VQVSHVRSNDNDIGFHVSRTGVPVVVKASYFPNWRVKGAEGPWRLTPNLMVVVPTSHDVRLHYTRTSVEWVGIVVTLLGIAGAVGLARWRPAPAPDPRGPRGERDGDPAASTPDEADVHRDRGDSAHQPAIA